MGRVWEKKQTAIWSDDRAVRVSSLPHPFLTELEIDIEVTYLFFLIFFFLLIIVTVIERLLVVMVIVKACNRFQEQAISSTRLRPKLI